MAAFFSSALRIGRKQGKDSPISFSFENINCRELVTTKQPAISKDSRLRNCALDHADYDTNQHCYFFCADFYLKIFDCYFHNVLLF